MIPRDNALAIRGLVCGVDGVLTNGTVGYSSQQGEIYHFDTRDGLAIRLANWYGLKVAWITGRISQQISQRAHDLDVPYYPGFANKEVGLKIIARDLGLQQREIAYIGNDLNDLLAFRLVGFPIAVASAPYEVKSKAAYITQAAGGQGAVREVVEALFTGQGCWDAAVENYLNVLREPDRVRRMPRTEE